MDNSIKSIIANLKMQMNQLVENLTDPSRFNAEEFQMALLSLKEIDKISVNSSDSIIATLFKRAVASKNRKVISYLMIYRASPGRSIIDTNTELKNDLKFQKNLRDLYKEDAYKAFVKFYIHMQRDFADYNHFWVSVYVTEDGGNVCYMDEETCGNKPRGRVAVFCTSEFINRYKDSEAQSNQESKVTFMKEIKPVKEESKDQTSDQMSEQTSDQTSDQVNLPEAPMPHDQRDEVKPTLAEDISNVKPGNDLDKFVNTLSANAPEIKTLFSEVKEFMQILNNLAGKPKSASIPTTGDTPSTTSTPVFDEEFAKKLTKM
jgi:hypothetical protein